MQHITITAVETVSGVELSMSLVELGDQPGVARRGTTGYRRTVPWDEVPDHPAGFPGWVAQLVWTNAYRLRAS